MIIYLIALVQIVLESLPVSSSGHLALLEHFTGVALARELEYLLHGPTIAMFAVYFYKRWSFMLLHVWRLRHVVTQMLLFGICAEFATVIFYGAMQFLAPVFPLWLGFVLTGAGLYSLRFITRTPGAYEPVTLARAGIIGIAQGIAGLPGISRLATTLVVGQWLGLAPRTSFLFSCMIQWPLMVAGFGYGLTTGSFVSCSHGMLLMGVALAMVAAYFLLWWVELLCERRKLWPFAYYMPAPALLAFWFC